MGSFILLLVAASVIVWAIKQYNTGKTKRIPPVSFHIGYDDEETIDKNDWSSNERYIQCCPRPISATIKISYVDSGGEPSDRIIDVRECETQSPDGYMIGYCHLRRSVRTFRLDRVQSAVDMETGELIPSLTEFASLKYEASPVSAVDKLFASHADALRALLFIAKADGRFTAKEKEVFLEYCRSSYPDNRLNMNLIDDALTHVGVPTMQNYKITCGRLAKLEESNKEAIVDAAEAMIATQKTVSPEEESALGYMKKRFVAGK